MSNRCVVYVSVGNSDDKLTQAQWSRFQIEVDRAVRRWGATIHGVWVSQPVSEFQNACWCFETVLSPFMKEQLQSELAKLAAVYNQDAIAWAEVRDTEFISPAK